MPNEKNDTVSPKDAEIASLQREKEILSQQVKRLIKAEGKLYAFQEELDAQLKEYKELYELSKKITATTDVQAIFEHAIAYAIHNLEYERAIIFQDCEEIGNYAVCALDGFYHDVQKSEVAQLVIDEKAPLLTPLSAGKEYLICLEDECDPVLQEYRTRLYMNEYLIYRLGPASSPVALLAVGNSADNAEFYRKVRTDIGSLVGLGNFASLISSSIENAVLYAKMEKVREQERVAEARYRSIFENAVEGIFLRTPDGRYLAANPALARMLGYVSPEELMSEVTDISQQLYVQPERHAELMRLLEEHGVVTGFDARMYRKDKSVIWVSISVRVAQDGGGAARHFEGTIENITERKRAEEALRDSERKYRQLSESLEQRVARAVEELRRKDRLLIIQSRQALMGEMISNIAHQWRQPLNMLGLLAQELPVTYQYGSFDKEYLEAMVKKEMEIIQHMSKTIDDFRDFFKPDNEKVEFSALENIRNTISLLEGTLKASQIEVEIRAENNPVILGYPNQFSQVVINILNNARDAFVKRRTESPLIVIRLGTEDGRTVVRVSDNAGGIPEEIMDKIFEPYFTTKGPEQGTGIGLFMSKTIVEKHMQGTLEVHNIGKGAEFKIKI